MGILIATLTLTFINLAIHTRIYDMSFNLKYKIYY